MMTNMINRLAIWSAIATAGMAVFGWIFRIAFHWLFHGTPGQGAQLLIFFTVLLFASLAMIFGLLLLVVPAWRNVRLAISVLVTSLVTPPVYYIVLGLLISLLHM